MNDIRVAGITVAMPCYGHETGLVLTAGTDPWGTNYHQVRLSWAEARTLGHALIELADHQQARHKQWERMNQEQS